MGENSEKSKLLLFLSLDNEEYGLVASSTFEDQAKTMDVMWTSHAKILNSSNEIDNEKRAVVEDLKSADLVILLQKSGSKTELKSQFSGWQGKHEVWDFLDQADVHAVVNQNVGSLLVRLILLGGKRKPIPGQAGANNGAATHGAAHHGPGSSGKQSDTTSFKDSVRVSRESKGRRGKTVTIISGLSLDDANLQELAARLKQICGTGGTVKDGKIEIQGDQCDRIMTELQSRGYKAKRSGG